MTQGILKPYTYTPPTIEEWHAIAEAITATTEGTTTLEGGGAACTFIGVQMPDGRYIALGDMNETWGADIYDNQTDVYEGLGPDTSIDLAIPVRYVAPQAIANALQDALHN